MISVETYATAEEASNALSAGGRFLAGGTIVMIELNYGANGIDRIVRTTDPKLREIHIEGNQISLGAHVTMADILGNRDLPFLMPAAVAVGGPGVRSAATVGGNLFAPHPYGDFSVALLALDAMVHTADGSTRPVEEFLNERRGLVTSVSFNRPTGDEFRFRKIQRVRPKGASVLSLAARLSRSAGRLSDTRIAYGAMGDRPLRAKAVEQALEGASLDENGIKAAVERATESIDPPTDSLASSWYRQEVAPVHLRRLLLGEERR